MNAIYGTFYFGYGGPGEEGDRRAISEDIEQRIMTFAPETVLVLVKASAEVIAERLRREPRSNGVLKEKDIAYILGRFEEGYANSSLRRKIELDTSSSTANETMDEFVAKSEPHLTEQDRVRMLMMRSSQNRTAGASDLDG